MQRSLLALVFSLSFAAPALAQDVLPPAPPPVVMTAPAAAPVVMTPSAPMVVAQPAPTYAAPTYAYAGRGQVGRAVVGTRHEMQNDRGLWGLGLGLFLAGWVLDIAVTALANAISTDRTPADEQDAQAWSILPLVGPIVQLGVGAPHPAIPITFELMQLGGLTLFVLGMTSSHDAEVPVYAWGDAHDASTTRLGFAITPTAGGAYATLTLHAM